MPTYICNIMPQSYKHPLFPDLLSDKKNHFPPLSFLAFQIFDNLCSKINLDQISLVTTVYILGRIGKSCNCKNKMHCVGNLSLS